MITKYPLVLLIAVFIGISSILETQAQGQIESIEQALKKLEEYKLAGEQEAVNQITIQIAFLYWNQGEGEKAIEFFEKSLAINQGVGNPNGIAHAYHNIGVIYSEMGQYTRSVESLNQALITRRNQKDKRGMTNTLLYLGISQFENKDYTAAAKNLEECLVLATELNSVVEITDSYLYLSKTYEASGQKELALKYHKLYTDGFKVEGQEYISGLTKQFEEDKSVLEQQKKLTELELQQRNRELEIMKLREREIAALAKARKSEIELLKKTQELQEAKLQEQEAKIRADRILISSIIAVLLLTGLLAMAISWAYILKNKSNKQLQSQKREIEKNSIQLRIQNEKIAAREESISEKNKQLEINNQKLLELHEEVRQLNHILVNDLRDPLNHLEDLLEIIDEHVAQLTPEQIDYINVIAESTMHFRTLISDIETIERIKEESKQLNKQAEDVSQLLGEVLSEVKRQSSEIENKAVDFIFESNGNSQFLTLLDRKYAFKVFEHLILNAAKVTPEGKPVRIHLNEENGRIITKIQDSGPGISEEAQKLVFAKYNPIKWRGEDGDKKGKGLKVMKEYIEAMNGQVWCESSPENGTTFFVEFDTLKAMALPHD